MANTDSSGPKEAEEAKKKGNDCIKEKKYIEAMLHYTHAIKIEPRNHTLYSNRSLAFLRMDQYYHAMEDAYKVIELKPDWPKGYFRKGEIEFKTEHFNEALASYKQGLMMDSDDTGLQEAVARTSRMLRGQRTKEGRMPIYGLLISTLIGLMVVIGDETLTKTPTLNHIVLKILVLTVFVGFGFLAAKGFRYFVRSQRDSLLDAPIDIFTGEKEKSTIQKPNSNAETENVNSPASKTRKGGSAAARQRYRMGKS